MLSTLCFVGSLSQLMWHRWFDVDRMEMLIFPQPHPKPAFARGDSAGVYVKRSFYSGNEFGAMSGFGFVAPDTDTQQLFLQVVAGRLVRDAVCGLAVLAATARCV